MTVDVVDLSDDNLAEAYLDDKKVEKEVAESLKVIKTEAFNRLDDKGKPDGKEGRHRLIETDNYLLKKEVRVTRTVVPEKAVALFESNKWQSEIEAVSIISIRNGIDPNTIPADLLAKMDKFFDIKVEKTVDKKTIEKKHQEGMISDTAYNDCFSEKESNALKVSKK